MSAAITIPVSQLGFDYDLLLHPWSEKLIGYRCYQDGTQEELEGGTGLSIELLAHWGETSDWLATIPADLRQQSTPFAEYQYQMLYLAAHYPQAEDLLRSRPLLLALICHYCHIDNDKARQLCQLGQRQILQALHLAHSKAALKFIDRLDLSYEMPNEMPVVIKVLNAALPRFQVFQHYDKVSFDALMLDHRYPFLTGSRFVHALLIASNRERVTTKRLLQDTINLLQALNVGNIPQIISNLASVEALINLHDRLAQRRNRVPQAQLPQVEQLIDQDAPYPEHAALLGNEQIERIVDYEDLLAEANTQQHCAAIYHNPIMLKNYVMFRMKQPERMTIGVRHDKRRAFPYIIEQIAGYQNAVPEEATLKVVYRWFIHHRDQYLQAVETKKDQPK